MRLLILIALFFTGRQALSAPSLLIPIENNFKRLLSQEDTNHDRRITVSDRGPKRFDLTTVDGKKILIEDEYVLANLLGVLALGVDQKQESVSLRPDELYASPVRHLHQLIREEYWPQLTRSLAAEGIAKLLEDPKTKGKDLRLYVPYDDQKALRYYQSLRQSPSFQNIRVERLPQSITAEVIRSLNDQPGILSLGCGESSGNDCQPRSFVVPGGRFNEQYGWDSYFMVLGLLQDNRIELAKNMVENFVYEIHHYGKILNANRTYYLSRSQPPFLTSMALAVYNKMPRASENTRWLKKVMLAAIQEYELVWTQPPHLTPTGLSRFFDIGTGIPPEVDVSEYKEVLAPYAERFELTLEQFVADFNNGAFHLPELDEYFLHDRSMRESGHDTTYRLVNRSANLAPVSLNALLYKYETDLARVIENVFNGRLTTDNGQSYSAGYFQKQARERQRKILTLLWDDKRNLFFDYDFKNKRRLEYVAATTFYPLWAGLVPPEKAKRLVAHALPALEKDGGILGSTQESRGPIGPRRPLRQWDYPYGWAPHQMLVWEALRKYGYREHAQRLIYKWLYMVALNGKRFSNAIVEKYDVTDRTFGPHSEYGNVGTAFEYYSKGGFGWTNASFQVGLSALHPRYREDLERMIPPELVFF